jgi:hypothetical protein
MSIQLSFSYSPYLSFGSADRRSLIKTAAGSRGFEKLGEPRMKQLAFQLTQL